KLDAADDFFNAYEYDALSRVTKITQSGNVAGDAFAEKRVDFSYDAAGQPQQIARYSDLAGNNPVAATDFVFDQIGRLTSMTHSGGEEILADYDWTYDAANRVTSFSDAAHPDENAAYNYD